MVQKEIIAVVGILLIISFVVIGFYLGWFSLTDLASFAISVAGVGIVGLFVWGFKPRFEPKPVLVSEPELTIDYDENNIQQYRPLVGDSHRVLRIRVINKSNQPAENCEARLEAFDSKGHIVMQEQYLQWSKNDVAKLEVPRHDSVFLNVVFSTKNGVDDYVAYASTTQSSDFEKSPRSKDGLKVGKYKLRIRIKPPSFNDALYGLFDLDVKEKWEEITMRKTGEYSHSE